MYLLSFIFEFTWLLIIGLLPVYFSLNTFSAWVINKFAFFVSLTIVLIFLWLAKMIFTESKSPDLQGRSGLKSLKPLIPIFIFILVLGCSTVFSLRPEISFWGSYQRKFGYFTWLLSFLFFLVLFFNLKTEKQIKRIVWVIFFSAIAVILYGFLQILGLDPIGWLEPPLLTKRVFSTIGQPNFLASWFLLVIPTIGWLFLKEKKFLVKSLIFLVFFLSLACFLLTGSRGGLIGLIAGIFFFFFALSLIKRKRKMFIAGLITLLFIIISMFFLNIFLPQNQKTAFFKNYPSLARFLILEGGGGERIVIWQNALSLIKKRPILGFGPETQFFNFITLYQPVEGVLESVNNYTDRAHNDLLEITYTSGFFGLTAYLLMIIYIFYLGTRINADRTRINADRTRINHGLRFCPPEKQNPQLNLFLLTGLLAYLVSLQFSFHEISGLVYFWLYFALILRTQINADQKTQINADQKTQINADRTQINADRTQINADRTQINADRTQINADSQRKSAFPKTFNKIILLIILELLTILFIWQTAGRLVQADIYYKKVIVSKIKNDWPKILNNYQKVFLYASDEIFYQTKFAEDLFQGIDFYQDKEKKITILNNSIERLERANEGSEIFQITLDLARVYTLKAGLTREKKDFEKANELFKHLKELSPGFPHFYKDWIQLKIFSASGGEKWQEAEDLCFKALNLYPDIDDPRLNQEHKKQLAEKRAEIYEQLGKIYFSEKKYSQAKENYQQALRLTPQTRINLHKKLADIYYLEGDLEKAIRENIHGYFLNPKDPVWSYSISFLYHEKEDQKKAIDWVKICQALGPEDKDIQNFLKKILIP